MEVQVLSSPPNMKKQNAEMTITFSDGSTKTIILKKVLVIDTSGKQEMSFRETTGGDWILTVTKSFLENKELADRFLSVEKIPA